MRKLFFLTLLLFLSSRVISIDIISSDSFQEQTKDECTFVFECDILVYDDVLGPAVPVSGAVVEPYYYMCPFESWLTGTDGRLDIRYLWYTNWMYIRIYHDDYEQGCFEVYPAGHVIEIGLRPDHYPHHDGDVNLDGRVTAADAQITFLYIQGYVQLNYEQRAAADCNGDIDVTAQDAQLIFFVSLGQNRCVIIG